MPLNSTNQPFAEIPSYVVANLLDCCILVCLFEHQSRYNVQFRTNALRTVGIPLSSSNYELNSITTSFGVK